MSERACGSCGRVLPPSNRHKDCGTCRGARRKVPCKCGRKKDAKARECKDCTTARAALKKLKPQRKVKGEHPHGTRQRYQGTRKIDPCRCDECREANNEYMRELRNPELHRKYQPVSEYRSEWLYD